MSCVDTTGASTDVVSGLGHIQSVALDSAEDVYIAVADEVLLVDTAAGTTTLVHTAGAAILDMVADGAGYAVLPRNALLNSPVPSAYSAQVIGAPPLRIALSLATSLQRPATQAQKTTLDLVRLTVSEVLRPA